MNIFICHKFAFCLNRQPEAISLSWEKQKTIFHSTTPFSGLEEARLHWDKSATPKSHNKHVHQQVTWEGRTETAPDCSHKAGWWFMSLDSITSCQYLWAWTLDPVGSLPPALALTYFYWWTRGHAAPCFQSEVNRANFI